MRRRGREKRRREGERRKKEEEKEKESQGMETLCLDTCLEVWNLICVSLELWYGNYMCLDLMFGITCLSWVRKTLTFQYMCFWLV